jgi:hypothetical protein
MSKIKGIIDKHPELSKLSKKQKDELAQFGEGIVQQSRNRIMFKRIVWGIIIVSILAFLTG